MRLSPSLSDFLFFLMIRRPPRSTLDRSSAASDVYKRQVQGVEDEMGVHLRTQGLDLQLGGLFGVTLAAASSVQHEGGCATHCNCLLYTSDAADERSSVDLGGRRIIKKKKYQG